MQKSWSPEALVLQQRGERWRSLLHSLAVQTKFSRETDYRGLGSDSGVVKDPGMCDAMMARPEELLWGTRLQQKNP